MVEECRDLKDDELVDFISNDNSLTNQFIIFKDEDNNSEEFIKITNEGFFVKGKKIVDDYEIYKAFIEFLNFSRRENDIDLLPTEPPIETESLQWKKIVDNGI